MTKKTAKVTQGRNGFSKSIVSQGTIKIHRPLKIDLFGAIKNQKRHL